MAGIKSNTMVCMMMMVFMVATIQMQTTMAQTRHVVGDTLGWTIPTGDAYTTWASSQTFNLGDTLLFNFTTGFHDVAEVSQAAYSPCTTANPINTITTGPATVTLTTAGAHYYICTFGTHCQNGQKLQINVFAAGSTAPPPATTTPPPASSPTPPTMSGPSPSNRTPPSPAGNTTPPPPSPSTASRSFTAVVPATFLAVALAFF